MKQTEKLLKALANHRRLAIVVFLCGRENASVGAIAREINLSFKATSRHLSILRAADALDRAQVNLRAYYSLHKPLSGIVKSVLSAM